MPRVISKMPRIDFSIFPKVPRVISKMQRTKLNYSGGGVDHLAVPGKCYITVYIHHRNNSPPQTHAEIFYPNLLTMVNYSADYGSARGGPQPQKF